jgi:hypothetical protein
MERGREEVEVPTKERDEERFEPGSRELLAETCGVIASSPHSSGGDQSERDREGMFGEVAS